MDHNFFQYQPKTFEKWILNFSIMCYFTQKLELVYNWLVSLPLKERSYILNKQQFWDAICIRYNQAGQIYQLCGLVDEITTCSIHFRVKKRFGNIKAYGNQRSISRFDVQKVPSLLPMTRERIDSSANTSNKAWLDVGARDFWIPTQNIDKVFQTNKKEKKRL